MTLIKLTTTECELMTYLIDMESRLATIEMMESKDYDTVEKAERVCNGLSQLFFVKTLFVLQSTNQNATIHLNQIAMQTMTAVLNSASNRVLPDRISQLYGENCRTLFQKFDSVGEIPTSNERLS